MRLPPLPPDPMSMAHYVHGKAGVIVDVLRRAGLS
jgi:hypothetical protein